MKFSYQNIIIVAVVLEALSLMNAAHKSVGRNHPLKAGTTYQWPHDKGKRFSLIHQSSRSARSHSPKGELSLDAQHPSNGVSH